MDSDMGGAKEGHNQTEAKNVPNLQRSKERQKHFALNPTCFCVSESHLQGDQKSARATGRARRTCRFP